MNRDRGTTYEPSGSRGTLRLREPVRPDGDVLGNEDVRAFLTFVEIRMLQLGRYHNLTPCSRYRYCFFSPVNAQTTKGLLYEQTLV